MKAWTDFLNNLEKKIGSHTVNQWLRPLNIVQYDACNIYLEADNFQISWFEEHIRPLANRYLKNNNFHPIRVHFQTSSKKKVKQSDKFSFKISEDPLDPRFNLFNFLSFSSNEISLKILKKIIGYEQERHSLGSLNPIFIHGPSGCGKTHCLMGIADFLKNQGFNVFFVNAQRFAEHVVQAIRLGQMEIFRKAYRNIDVLIVDDIHVFSRKNATQEEFFHTFNTLHLKTRQIILSANDTPLNLEDIEPRLISRFDWGINLKLNKPDHLDVENIMTKKIEQYQLQFDKEAFDFLLQSFSYQAKKLHKALDILLLRSQINHQAVFLTKEFIKKELSDLLKKEQSDSLNFEKIIKAISTFFGIKTTDILSKVQTKEFTYPRQLAMYFCRNKLELPYKKIADHFDRDHSTVMSSIKSIDKKLQDKRQEIHHHIAHLEKIFEKKGG